MAKYLRDEMLSNLTIDDAFLSLINDELVEYATKLNLKLREQETLLHEENVAKYEQQVAENRSAVTPNPIQVRLIDYRINYVIRFDNKGYVIDTFDEFIKHFKTAKQVERVVLTLSDGNSSLQHEFTGSRIELKVDAIQANNCSLTVEGNAQEWVTAAYTTCKDLINNQYNSLRINRTGLLGPIIRAILNVVGAVLSLVAAQKTQHWFDNSLILSFAVAIVLFSSFTTVLYQLCTSCIDKLLPNIRIRNSNDYESALKKIVYAILVTIAGSVVIYYASEFVHFVVNSLTSLSTK